MNDFEEELKQMLHSAVNKISPEPNYNSKIFSAAKPHGLMVKALATCIVATLAAWGYFIATNPNGGSVKVASVNSSSPIPTTTVHGISNSGTTTSVASKLNTNISTSPVKVGEKETESPESSSNSCDTTGTTVTATTTCKTTSAGDTSGSTSDSSTTSSSSDTNTPSTSISSSDSSSPSSGDN